MSDDKSKSTPAPAQPQSSGPGAPQTGASAPAAAAPGAPTQAAGAPAAAKPAGPPPVKIPPLVPFVAQPDREKIDSGEHAADGSRPMYADREWIGYAQQGGGKVPEDWSWPHSPKQEQDEEM